MLVLQAVLARSRSRERAAEAQRRRRLQRPKTRVVLSTSSASKGSYRILQEDRPSLLVARGGSHKTLGDWSLQSPLGLGGSYQRLEHRTEPRLQLRSYSDSTPEALQKMQEDEFLYWSLWSFPASLWFLHSQRPAPRRVSIICYSYHVYDFTVYARICLERGTILIIYQHILSWDEIWEPTSCKWNLRSVRRQSRSMSKLVYSVLAWPC